MHYGVIQPVIILDGELFVASITDKLNIDVSPIKAGTLRIGYRSKEMKRQQSYVDIVTLDYLKTYLASFPKKNSAGLAAYLSERKHKPSK